MIDKPENIRSFLAGRVRREIDRPDLQRAGVLVLLFRKGGELHVLLTKRSTDVEHHKGQISFPGGSVDDHDVDIVATALRETEEEVGLSPSAIRVLGLFDDVWTPSGFRITPVIGYTELLPEIQQSSAEVEEILEVPLSFFLEPGNERVERLSRRGEPIDVYFFKHGSVEIWGATAAMIRSFVHALNMAKEP